MNLVPVLGISYITRLGEIAAEATVVGKLVGVAVAVFLVVAAMAINRRLGAVVATIIVVGVGLMAIDNPDALSTNAKDTFIGGAAPAGVITTPFIGR